MPSSSRFHRVVLAIPLLWPLALLAQHEGPPQLKINVHDPAGTPIANAAVVLAPAPLTLHTGADGSMVLDRTRETAELRVSAPGYEAKMVTIGLFSVIDVALHKAGGSLTGAATDSSTLTLQAAQQQVLTTAVFAKLPHQTVTVENGHTHRSETYSGVSLVSLLAPLGAPAGASLKGQALSQYVVATGADHYKAVLSLAEIEPDFHAGTVLVADTMDGKPLDAHEGPFKLVVSEDTRPARSVHNLISLELKQAE